MKALLKRLRASRRVRAELRRRARSQRGEVRSARRARIVLLSLEGLSASEVARRVAVDRNQVIRWRERFRRWGLTGLEDEPRSGRPARITQAERARVVAMACRKPEQFGLAQTLWTLDALAELAERGRRGPDLALLRPPDPPGRRAAAPQGEDVVHEQRPGLRAQDGRRDAALPPPPARGGRGVLRREVPDAGALPACWHCGGPPRPRGPPGVGLRAPRNALPAGLLRRAHGQGDRHPEEQRRSVEFLAFLDV